MIVSRSWCPRGRISPRGYISKGWIKQPADETVNAGRDPDNLLYTIVYPPESVVYPTHPQYLSEAAATELVDHLNNTKRQLSARVGSRDHVVHEKQYAFFPCNRDTFYAITQAASLNNPFIDASRHMLEYRLIGKYPSRIHQRWMVRKFDDVKRETAQYNPQTKKARGYLLRQRGESGIRRSRRAVSRRRDHLVRRAFAQRKEIHIQGFDVQSDRVSGSRSHFFDIRAR